jgi:zinc and cadmium transporter
VEALAWIVGSSLLMSAIALVGSLTLVIPERMLQRLMLPLVAFAAGSLIGGALLHMVPGSLAHGGSLAATFLWVLAGFVVFFALEQLLHWHHCHRASAQCRKPLSYLILIGDGLHNFLGGLAVASTFLIDIRLGITTWLAAAAHEVPQELGDFAVLVHGGWTRGRALLYNALSALTFLAGGLITYMASEHVDVSFLLPFAAGNFLYIGASDLVPEVNKHESAAANAVHLGAFVLGIALMAAVAHAGH